MDLAAPDPVPPRRVLRVGVMVVSGLVVAGALTLAANALFRFIDASGNPRQQLTVAIDGVPFTARLDGERLCVSSAGRDFSNESCFTAGEASLDATGMVLPTGTVVVSGRAPRREVQAVRFRGDGRVVASMRLMGPDMVFIERLPVKGVWTIEASGPRGRWVEAALDIEGGGTSGVQALP